MTYSKIFNHPNNEYRIKFWQYILHMEGGAERKEI